MPYTLFPAFNCTLAPWRGFEVLYLEAGRRLDHAVELRHDLEKRGERGSTQNILQCTKEYTQHS